MILNMKIIIKLQNTLSKRRTDLHLLVIFLIIFLIWVLLGFVVISDDHSTVLIVLLWIQDLHRAPKHR